MFLTKYIFIPNTWRLNTHIAKNNSIESCFHISNRNSLRMIGCKSVTTYKNNSTKIQHVFNIKRDSFAKSKKRWRSKIEVWSSNSNLASHTQTKQTKPIHLQHVNVQVPHWASNFFCSKLPKRSKRTSKFAYAYMKIRLTLLSNPISVPQK